MLKNTLTKNQQRHIINEKGMTFVEVLIALVIMVTGILGAVAMQAIAKKGSFDAMQRSVASSLAQDIIEKMRSNSNVALALYAANSPYGTGKIIGSPVCNSSLAICTPEQMVTHDLFDWEQSIMGAGTQKSGKNAGGLTNGIGCITVNGNSVTIVLTWQGKTESSDANKASTCGSISDMRRQVFVEAFIF
ncbi:MAG: type IV pilus modification protein PilV [Litorilituus sp.]|jgi:type IV pilus assembly protein PilV|nr:type IV pilus modification protein PilV [Litorilituus sp.]